MRYRNYLPTLLLGFVLTGSLAAPAFSQDRYGDRGWREDDRRSDDRYDNDRYDDRYDDNWWDVDEWGPRGCTSSFDRLDRNNDGYISRSEWAGNDRVSDRVDRNDDRRLSRYEVRTWEDNRMDRLEDRFRENDDNRDRRL